jgi:flagellar biosynthesis protein FlhF
MLVKTFQAGEMSEALRMVKAEMGQDAMILSSKKERRKGILGYFTKPYFEVTAALEPRTPKRPNPYREEPAPQPRERELSNSTREEFQNSMLGPLAREVRELKLKVEALSKREQAAPPQPAKAEMAEQGPRTFGKEELEEIKKLLYSAVAGNSALAANFPPSAEPARGVDNGQGSREPKTVTFPLAGSANPLAQRDKSQAAPLQGAVEALLGTRLQEARAAHPQSSARPLSLELLEEELRGEEVDSAAVALLLKKLRPAAEGGAKIGELRKLLAESLSGMVKCTGALRMKRSGSRIMAVVGPTGVGKTTTIAKLAAMHVLNRRLSVALITTDNFRVGAVEQLKTYAKIMDLPLEVVASSDELASALAKHSDKDLVLIDTAGRSPKDSDRIDELKGFLECHPGIETCLCVSATTRSRELDEIVAVFGGLPVSKLLFTKLDESESYGCIVNAHLRHKLPLSYLTTGQKVPEDIEIATSKKLASLVVKESAQ